MLTSLVIVFNQINRFKTCEDYASNKVGVKECYSREELRNANPEAPMRGRTTSEDAVDELLCVVKENHNFKVNELNYMLHINIHLFSLACP